MKRLVLAVVVVGSGCAAAHEMASAPMTATANAPPPLERSLFARDPNGQLTEDALQRILASQAQRGHDDPDQKILAMLDARRLC